MEAILKCEIAKNGTIKEVEYLFHCTDKNGNVLSSAVGNWLDIEGWIENDVLLQGACNDGYEPPPTSTITTTTKSTTTEPASCEYLKSAGFDLIDS